MLEDMPTKTQEADSLRQAVQAEEWHLKVGPVRRSALFGVLTIP